MQAFVSLLTCFHVLAITLPLESRGQGTAAIVDGSTTKPPVLRALGQSRYFAASDGTKLHYLEVGPLFRGSGAVSYTLVFIPGWAMPGDIWQPQIEHFARNHRVIVFDPRGQGGSESGPVDQPPVVRARDIKELLDSIGDEQVVLIGWSLATQELLAFAKQYGEARVRAFVFVDNSVRDNPPPGEAFRNAMRDTPEVAMRRFVRTMFVTRQTDEYLDGLAARATVMPYRMKMAVLDYREPRAYWDSVTASLTRPVWYAVTPNFAKQAAYLKAKLPWAKVTIFERAGHAIFVDQPESFNRELRLFLDSLDRR